MSSLAIVNAGLILSGELSQPLLEADCVLAGDSKISRAGLLRNWTDMRWYFEFYWQGRLKLDQLVTQTLRLDQINKAFEDMKEGHVARRVAAFD